MFFTTLEDVLRRIVVLCDLLSTMKRTRDTKSSPD